MRPSFPPNWATFEVLVARGSLATDETTWTSTRFEARRGGPRSAPLEPMREQVKVRREASEEVPSLVSVDLDASAHRVEQLPELVQTLWSLGPDERPAHAERINELLIAMRAPGHEAEEGELMLELLTTKVLNEVVDSKGRSCRREIVETLMACGYPHALFLDPADAVFARTWRPPRPSQTEVELEGWERALVSNRRLGAVVMMVAQVAAAVLVIRPAPPVGTAIFSFATWVAAGLLATWIGSVRPRHLNIGVAGAAVTLVLLAQAFAALVLKVPALLVSAAGLGLGLFVSLRGLQPERDLDWPQRFDEAGAPTVDPWGRRPWQEHYGERPDEDEAVLYPRGDYWTRQREAALDEKRLEAVRRWMREP